MQLKILTFIYRITICTLVSCNFEDKSKYVWIDDKKARICDKDKREE